MKILILDGGNANTLAIVRYLGRHRDLELDVVGYNKLAQACYSKPTRNCARPISAA